MFKDEIRNVIIINNNYKYYYFCFDIAKFVMNYQYLLSKSKKMIFFFSK
jgi:hypothetical protein